MTGSIKLRKWDYADAATVAVYANNRKIADNLRDAFPHPYSFSDANNFIQAALKDDSSAHLFAIDLNGEAIGSIGAIFKKDVYRKNAEIGYWLAEDHWGKGFATEAIRLIIKYIFDNFDIERVYAEPFADNKASVRILEKSGFSLEARFRRNVIKNNIIKDSFIYSILRSEYEQLKKHQANTRKSMKEIINSFISNRELALAGVSASREKWGNALFRALKKKGYTVYPVNPGLDEVEGTKCYRSVEDLPDHIENLILATPPFATDQIVKQCKETAIKRIWMHRGGGGTGAQSDSAIEFVKDNNMQVVYGLCPMMFFPPVGIHKVHLWLRKATRNIPEEYKEVT